MKFKTELHCHTAECSKCSRISCEEIIERYIAEGYSSIVITDHYGPKHFGYHGDVNEAEYVFTGYKKAKEIANGRINVLCGIEVCLACHYQNDYLLYGDVETALLKKPDVCELEYQEFCEWAHENNLLLVQAHPFRNGITVVNASFLDGVEIFNGHPRIDSRNPVACAWADYFGIIGTSGSDAHRTEDMARGGIVTETEIKSMEELVSILKSKNYEIITTA